MREEKDWRGWRMSEHAVMASILLDERGTTTTTITITITTHRKVRISKVVLMGRKCCFLRFGLRLLLGLSGRAPAASTHKMAVPEVYSLDLNQIVRRKLIRHHTIKNDWPHSSHVSDLATKINTSTKSSLGSWKIVSLYIVFHLCSVMHSRSYILSNSFISVSCQCSTPNQIDFICTMLYKIGKKRLQT